MKKTVILLLVAGLAMLLLQSCSMQKYCQENYPCKIDEKDSTSTTIVVVPVHDTMWLPKEEVAFDTIIPPLIFKDSTKSFTKTKTFNRVTGSVTIKGNKLSFKCTADSLQHVIDTQQKTITTLELRRQIMQTLTPKPVYLEHWYVLPLIWYFIITILMAIIYLVRVIIKIYTRS